jgi:cold shock CspA family protein/uncharacterized LabA/DUF88 family protein
MRKVMIFIDGTWLYYNKSRLAPDANADFHLDYGKIATVLAEELEQILGGQPVDVVRTHFFGSYPENCAPQDEQLAERPRGFFAMLKDRYGYEISAFPTDFRGRRLRRQDRAPDDHFEPRQNCVDIALASEFMYYAALPHALDYAVLIGGARDFVPLLQLARRLGKRTAIASIHGSCAGELCGAVDEYGVRDLPVIWLDELMDELSLDPVTNLAGPDETWDEDGTYDEEYEPANPGDLIEGVIKNTIEDRGFGFIVGSDGNDYFFHLSDLHEEVTFAELAEGLAVQFEVKRMPNHSRKRAGAAQNVSISI